MRKSFFVKSFTAAAVVLFLGVASSYCQVEDYTTWSNSKPFTINTTESGYNFKDTLDDFPYLIRLSKKDFTFSQAEGKGQDVRFSNASGTHLPYEIEQWDSANGSASIWVKVTIPALSTTKITMWWGKKTAADQSQSAMVFDTGKGFLGVWHLNNNLLDATARANTGVSFHSADSSGTIARGRGFNYSAGVDSSYITIATPWKSLPTIATYSAWIKPTSLEGNRDIVSTGQIRLMAWGNVMALNVRMEDSSWKAVKSTTPLVLNKWNHIVGVLVKGQDMTVYHNGVKTGYSVISDLLVFNSTNATASIGSSGKTKGFFSGSIDELIIMNGSVSASWAKLSYENQRIPPESVPVIAYSKKEWTFLESEFFAVNPTIVPAIQGDADSVTCTPQLPSTVELDRNTGSISGFFIESSPKTAYYIRAWNMLGYTEDTLFITNVSDVMVFRGERTVAGKPGLLGIRRSAQPSVVFSVPAPSRINNLCFRLFDCKGTMVWSKTVSAGSLIAGVQTMPLERGPGTKISSGMYFLEMNTSGIDASDNVRTVKKAKLF